MRYLITIIFMAFSISVFACNTLVYDSIPENCASGTVVWSFTQTLDNGESGDIEQTKFICAPPGNPPAGHPNAIRV